MLIVLRMTCTQSDVEQIEATSAALSLDDDRDRADMTGHDQSWSDVDSGSHQRLPPSVPQLQHLVTSLQLELKQSHATQIRTR